MRPTTITISAVLLALLSLTNLPFPWDKVFPGEETPPDFIIAISSVLGIIGLAAAVGLWTMKRWSYWTAIADSALNFILAAGGLPEVVGAGVRIVLILSTIVAALTIVLLALPVSRRALSGADSTRAR